MDPASTTGTWAKSFGLIKDLALWLPNEIAAARTPVCDFQELAEAGSLFAYAVNPQGLFE